MASALGPAGSHASIFAPATSTIYICTCQNEEKTIGQVVQWKERSFRSGECKQSSISPLRHSPWRHHWISHAIMVGNVNNLSLRECHLALQQCFSGTQFRQNNPHLNHHEIRSLQSDPISWPVKPVFSPYAQTHDGYSQIRFNSIKYLIHKVAHRAFIQQELHLDSSHCLHLGVHTGRQVSIIQFPTTTNTGSEISIHDTSSKSPTPSTKVEKHVHCSWTSGNGSLRLACALRGGMNTTHIQAWSERWPRSAGIYIAIGVQAGTQLGVRRIS